MSVKAEIITIGDEILYGQTLDTNSHWISGKLDEISVRVVRKSTIPDVEQEILSAFSEAENRADLILVTGGLGPTKDDLTKPCLAKHAGVKMIENEDVIRDLQTLFDRMGREMSLSNREQALMPVGAEKITNELGTAPGIWLEKSGKIFIAMPGIPHEMKGLMKKHILPKIKDRFIKKTIIHKIIRTCGVPESMLAEKISYWEDSLPHYIKLAYLPSLAQVKLRLTAEGDNHELLNKELDDQIEKVVPLIEKFVFATENIELEECVGRLLKESGKKIACAESCTGGYLSHLFTSIPGSSAYFNGSIIAYSNQIKEEVLKIHPTLIDKHGAVSEEVVLNMARKIKEIYNVDIGISISGVAGPDGSEAKPVGTVWIGISDETRTYAKKFVFAKNREMNIKFSSLMALNMIRNHII